MHENTSKFVFASVIVQGMESSDLSTTKLGICHLIPKVHLPQCGDNTTIRSLDQNQCMFWTQIHFFSIFDALTL